MKITNILLCLVLIFSYVPPASAAIEQPKLQVIIFGDELTGNQYLPADKRFDAQLEKKLKDIGFLVEVSNITLVETTSTEAIKKLDSILAKAPDVVIIQIGSTDVKRGLSQSNLGSNILYMTDTLKQRGVYPIVMGARAPDSRGAAYVSSVDQAFRFVSGKVQLYPDTLGGITGREDHTIGDGYRPNARGVAVMVEGIYRLVDAGLRWRLEVINHIRSKQLQQVMP